MYLLSSLRESREWSGKTVSTKGSIGGVIEYWLRKSTSHRLFLPYPPLFQEFTLKLTDSSRRVFSIALWSVSLLISAELLTQSQLPRPLAAVVHLLRHEFRGRVQGSDFEKVV